MGLYHRACILSHAWSHSCQIGRIGFNSEAVDRMLKCAISEGIDSEDFIDDEKYYLLPDTDDDEDGTLSESWRHPVIYHQLDRSSKSVFTDSLERFFSLAYQVIVSPFLDFVHCTLVAD
ncbi:hypothetical protein CROQUDRAFT_97795 [Cronartium quercuum f. sp. fusiforme G11]|uniref:Uncharacterized protein n=1 Tax=Cronartium quercuum f. sp. fusiforme G11 TaxID=708437 RepID=A0A9P6T958_9BASI|nr:hypothetical protein CROQUDRAFT_97795 [Cronartium quercuum f. sp. fusiforme G11]